MAKQLLLVRHAQAESQGAGVKDFDRELLSSGFTEASRIGKKLYERGIKVEKVVSSSAARASMTAELVAAQIQFPLNRIIFRDELYEAPLRELLTLVNSTEYDFGSLMIVGHNPVISYFAEYLVSDQIGSLPTAGVVGIELEVESWTDVSAAVGKIKFLEAPGN